MSIASQISTAIVIAALAGCSFTRQAPPDSGRRLVLAEQGYFFVGGAYANLKNDEIRLGQMYVQYQIPEETPRNPIQS